MKSDDTELIIDHKGKQVASVTEADEVDINVQATEQYSAEDTSGNLEPGSEIVSSSETTPEPKSEPDPEPDPEPADLVDEIQAKMNSYPLPTPAISEMLPPTPPAVEHNNQA